MSKVIDQWVAAHEKEHGPYAAFAGFEAEVRSAEELVGLSYDDMNVEERAFWFEFVTKLLGEEASLPEPIKETFMERRAERLQLLDAGVRTCEQNRLSPSVEQLKEAVQIGFELLEECHRNNVQGRLANLVERATKLVDKVEQEDNDG